MNDISSLLGITLKHKLSSPLFTPNPNPHHSVHHHPPSRTSICAISRCPSVAAQSSAV